MTKQEIERQKRVVEDLLSDYEKSVAAYAEWMARWRERQAQAKERSA